LLPPAQHCEEPEELAELVAWQLLARWGVVFRDVYLRERLALSWREILWALRRLEARGLIRGGHFVTGITGEQFADESTLPLLRPRRVSSTALRAAT
jgi:ATP-dependent Lhr-like helicase